MQIIYFDVFGCWCKEVFCSKFSYSQVYCVKMILAAVAVCISLYPVGAAASDLVQVEDSKAEMALLDGRNWDKVQAGPLVVDAVHRAVLLRFPGLKSAAADARARGLDIVGAELELQFDGIELHPDGYVVRDGLGMAKWKGSPPRWHVVVWQMRRGWASRPNGAATFLAAAPGEPWSLPGAQDTDVDRYPEALQPVELSEQVPVGKIDLLPYLCRLDGAARDKIVAEMATNGFLLQKLEAFDSRYRDAGDAYEWAVPTGGHGLRFKEPKIRLTFGPKPADCPTLAPPPPPPLLQSYRAQPTPLSSFALPTERSVAEARRILSTYPAAMTEAQRNRMRELLVIGGDSLSAWLLDLASGSAAKYEAFLRTLWQTPPRYWKGWGIQDDIILSTFLSDLLPDHIKRHLARYWSSWLMPDVPTSDVLFPLGKQITDYYEKTGDWRGRASFFRGGFNYSGSTQNFNHTASVGALLGGRLIQSDAAMADGRHGLDNLLLRYWSFKDGTSQEMLDHYYLSITLSAQKLLADTGPTLFDRLAGRIMVERTMEMLATIYHPQLRRMVGPSGRSRMAGMLVEQDGIYGALHALSNRGVLNYVGSSANHKVGGLPAFGYDFPPGRVGLQSLMGPWAPDWFADIIDDKPFPFEEVSAETVRGHFDPPLLRTSFLGATYGLASQDIKGGSVDVIAQWNGHGAPEATTLATMTAGYCVNRCNLVSTSGGIKPTTGSTYTFQDKNKVIIVLKAPRNEKSLEALKLPGGVTSLASALAFWRLSSPSDWEIFVGDRRLSLAELPLRMPSGAPLIIRDGRTYAYVSPLPSPQPFGGEPEIVLQVGGAGGAEELTRTIVEPVLTLLSYNYRSPEPKQPVELEWQAKAPLLHGGFIVELGDETDSATFSAFRARTRRLGVQVEEGKEAPSLQVTYRSGTDELSAAFGLGIANQDVHFPIKPGDQTAVILQRSANGVPRALPSGLVRDTNWSQQGAGGHLSKNGVTLLGDAGRMLYLIALPDGRRTLAYNPLPDPTTFKLSLPGGREIKADGKVGLLRVMVNVTTETIEIDHAVRDGNKAAGLARRFQLVGFPQTASVVVNGSAASSHCDLDACYVGGPAVPAVMSSP